ncbi:hypothetical protein PRZ48_002377 [Zasmidium cellare]|uniref:Xylanolytic transcriptional activator regulatory domain-containing protein n=1 Tax=Zasmidium cellare TaxID=395010 RepID=A0ABR0F5C4_ZASCE|nr:hypothetical protein PRZ48_002377 [Zasmidium cellare]
MLFIILIPLALISYLIVSFARNYYRLPRSFRGPFLACISDFWLFRQCITANLHYAEQALLHENASTPGTTPNFARIGPNVVVTNDPDLLRHMSLPKSRWTRSGWYSGFEMGGKTPHVFAERDEGRHKDLRGRLGNGYSGKGVDSLEPCIDAETANFITLLREQYARPRKTLDMTRLSQYFTLDVLSSIAFGEAFGFMASNSDKWDFVAGNESFLPMLQLITDLSFVRKFFHNPIVSSLLSPKETDPTGQGRVRRFAAEAIAHRFESGKEGRNDMLGSFKAHGLSLEECKSESLIQVIAGTDSTSTVLRMTMLYIASNPLVYRRLQAEVDSADVPSDTIIPDSTARQLPYLQAVIWEGLRKTPPLFGLESKVAPKGGETVNGVFFSGGVEVVNCLHAVTHREDIFGEDVEVFRPERWMGLEGEGRRKFESVVELVFGTGRYGCLGRNIAWIELGKVFFELMRHFDWEVEDPLKPIEKSRGHGAWVQKGMRMRLQKENQKLREALESSRQQQTVCPPLDEALNSPPATVSTRSQVQPLALDPVIKHVGRLVSTGPGQDVFAGSTTGVHFIRSAELKYQRLFESSEAFGEVFFRTNLLPHPASEKISSFGLPCAQIDHGVILSRSREYYMEKLDGYLLGWNQMFPVLCHRQAKEMLTSVLDAVSLGQHAKVSGLHQMLLMLAIETCMCNDDHRDECARYYNAAAQLESGATTQINLETMQSLLLKAIFDQLSGQHALVVQVVGRAVRVAQALGLHRNSRRFKFCAGEKELRTRLWWCVSMLEIISHGLPKLIRSADVDAGLPIDCDLEDSTASELPVPLPGESSSSTLLVAMCQLVTIMQRITETLFTTTDRRNGERKIRELGDQLRAWTDGFAALLDASPGLRHNNSLFVGYLRLLSLFNIILIHQPGLTFDDDHPQFSTSLSRSTEAAVAILTLLQDFSEEHRLFYLPPEGTRIVFQSLLICFFYAWHHGSLKVPASTPLNGDGSSHPSHASLESLVEVGLQLIEALLLECPSVEVRGELEQAVHTFRSMSRRTHDLFGQPGELEPENSTLGGQLLEDDFLTDWPSTLWDLNDSDFAEWSETYAHALFPTEHEL